MIHEFFDVRRNMAAGAEEIGTFLQRVMDSDTVADKFEEDAGLYNPVLRYLRETNAPAEIVARAERFAAIAGSNGALAIIDAAIQQGENYWVIPKTRINYIREALEDMRQTYGEKAYAQAVRLLCEYNPNVTLSEGRLVFKEEQTGYYYRE